MAVIPLQLARVSNLLRTNVATSALSRTQSALLRTSNELSTGKRINSPSDDPGAAAIAQQLHKTLEQRKAYSDNLKHAQSQLSEVDSSLGDLSDLLNEAQTIASANVGSDITASERASAAEIVTSLYNQALALANRQFQGSYLFGGDRATDQPFVESIGGVKFVGSERLLQNSYDESTSLQFQVDGSAIFGALSTRVRGIADLSPAISVDTRLTDLRGAGGDGVRLGAIQLSNGTVTETVDLSAADSIQDVINLINDAGVGTITAAIAVDGVSLALNGTGAENVSVSEVSGGTTATDLGILNTAGAGLVLDGSSVQPKVTPLTLLSDLKAGAGIDLASGIILTNGLSSATIDFTGATTVEGLMNRVNSSGTGVRAEINAAGNGINLINPTQGLELRIAENGGTTAQDLGIRSFLATTDLAELNGGKGVRTATGDDFQITDSNGVNVLVDIDGATTIQQVLDRINTAATTASAGITASFATTGNGIVLTDTAGGAGTIALVATNFSNAALDLGLNTTPSGTTITGSDIDPVTADGIFSNLTKLRDSLLSSDQQQITVAAEGLKSDYDRVVRIRGQSGARVQDFDSRLERLTDQDIATKALLSSLEDTDFTEAIARFQTLQTALEANLQTASRVLNLSLMDFLR